jgi:hypothetical protein
LNFWPRTHRFDPSRPCPPRGFHGRFRLSERQARGIEEDSVGIGQLDATGAARQQLCANLVFQVAGLTAERAVARRRP